MQKSLVSVNVKIIRFCTNFDAPDAHFNYLNLFSGTQAKKVENPGKKCKNCMSGKKKSNTVP
jgi:hypothetical protein